MNKNYVVFAGLFVLIGGLLSLRWENITTGHVVSSSPLSAEVKGGGSKTPVEIACDGPEQNDVGVREIVIRTYADGSKQSYIDKCRGRNYLNYYQCSRTQKARIVSCWYELGKGATCKDGACVK